MSLRRATPDDACELTRLRGLMYEAWTGSDGGDGWRDSANAMFRRRLADEPETFVAFVAEADGRVVSSGVGWIDEHLPNQHNLTGRRGHIASMSTEPAYRGRGYARAIVEALVAWFDERGLARIDLVATPAGEPIYRSLGFAEHTDAVALVRRAEDHAALRR